MRSGFVALLGRPNAGKSTLLNRVVGTKLAIVSDKPQTTRHRILGVKNYPDGQIVFVDTPGVHRPLHRMNVRMVDAALGSARDADVVVMLVDASERTGSGDRYMIETLRQVNMPVVLALNKIDRVAKPRLLPLIEWYRQQHEFTEIMPLSALTGDGVDILVQAVLRLLPESEALYPEDYLTDQSSRLLAAELVREQVLRHTHGELPFTTTVLVDRFEGEEEERALLHIYCSIVVERPSQKAIVIGRAGQMIKQIGTAARHELEAILGRHVYLDLHVKVREDWRDNERILNDAGLPGR
ncbi:MAG: GTPase Era [Luteitalea sp.]|nr:GTPase Era [Luteitalea sp.]